MNGETKTERTKAVTMRQSTYERLLNYRRKKQLPPSIVDAVSVAVERWLDEQEKNTEEKTHG